MSITDAYEAAGYKSNRHNAARMNTNEHIQARIAELQETAARQVTFALTEVINELGKIGFANMGDYMDVDQYGDPEIDFSALTPAQTAVLREVSVEEFKDGKGRDARDVRRVKFKPCDKLGALVALLKHLSPGHPDHGQRDVDITIQLVSPDGKVTPIGETS